MAIPNGSHSSGTNKANAKSMAGMPIAVIGLSGKFAGEASNPQKLWELIKHGRSALGEVPKSRFNSDGFFHPNAERAGSSHTNSGYFIQDDIRRFDAGFFSITPTEANGMDPTQRILLELAYESLENAGVRLDQVNGADVSCFVGACQHDYWDIQARDMDASPKYTATGTGPALLSNRISWFLNLKGPSVTIDTACSSSLTALHLACQSLRNGESNMALVGGLSLILLPNFGVFMSTLSFLSPDNRCHSFDKSANGYARGEGGGFLVLKPLEQALHDGDSIRAVIRASGANQDGRTPGITLPSGVRQEQLIRSVYEAAGLDLSSTAYFEAHGTGTAAGDPIECSAIGRIFGANRGEPILVGSVKSNMGHLEGASGIIGVIKAIYSLERGLIPPTFGLQEVNPKIKLAEWNIKIPTSLRRWPDGLRRVSINSFGYGGANAHCVLDEAHTFIEGDELLNGQNGIIEPPTSVLYKENGHAHGRAIDLETVNGQNHVAARKIFIWSSPEKAGLARLAAAFMTYLENYHLSSGESEVFLGRLALTLCQRRTLFPWRFALEASSIEELIMGLEKAPLEAIKVSKASDLVFIFTGQGAQWHAMGRELLQIPTFKDSLQLSGAILAQLGCEWDLLSELSKEPEETRINNSSISQPACTALQIALVDLFWSWGVRPRAAIGHSSGEIAAAYTKGAINQRTALQIAFFRGFHSESMKLQGSMAAVGLSPAQAQAYIERLNEGKAVIACINSPSSVTLSGDTSAINEAVAMITGDGQFARKLTVSTAYHSHHMTSIAHQYLQSLIPFEKGQSDGNEVIMFSSVTAKEVSCNDLDAHYWVTNLTNPVNFAGAVQAALGHPKKRGKGSPGLKINSFLELGPHSALQGPLKQVLEQTPGRHEHVSYISALKRNENAVHTVFRAAGKLACIGHALDFAAINQHDDTPVEERRPLLDLPSYPWNRDKVYWQESAAVSEYKNRPFPRLELLGVKDERSTASEPSWTNYLRTSEQPWIEHHRFQGTNVYPLAGMIVMAIEGLRQMLERSKIRGYQFRDVTVHQALVIPSDQPVETKLDIRPWRDGSRSKTMVWRDFVISSRTMDGVWTTNASGLVKVDYNKETTDNPIFVDENEENIQRLKERFREVENISHYIQNPDKFYSDISASGLDLGPSFKCVSDLKTNGPNSTFTLTVQDTKKWSPLEFESAHLVHPATLDGFVHLLISNAPSSRGGFLARVPVSVESFYVSEFFDSTPSTEYCGFCSSSYQGTRSMMTDVSAFAHNTGEPRVIIKGCRSVPLSGGGSGGQQKTKRNDNENISNEEWWLGTSSLPAENNDGIYCIPKWNTDAVVTSPKRLEQLLHKSLAVEVPRQNGHDEDEAIASRRNSQEKENLANSNSTNGVTSTDHDLLFTDSKNLLTASETKQGLQASRLDKALIHYISIMLHKLPECKILELADTTNNISDVILEGLSPTMGLSVGDISYTIAKRQDTKSNPEESKPNNIPKLATRLELDIEESFSEQALGTKGYDLVLVGGWFLRHGPTELKLARCKDLLASSGVLIIIDNEASSFSTVFPGHTNYATQSQDIKITQRNDQGDDIRQHPGFNGIDFMVLGDPTTSHDHWAMAVCQILPSEPTFQTDITILTALHTSNSTSQLIESVRQNLLTGSCDVSICTLAEASMADHSSTFFVVFVELDTPVLAEMTPEQLSLLKKLATESNGTLWLTVDEPLGAIAKGFSRTVRAENPNSCFGVVNIARNSHDDLDQASDNIVRIAHHVWDTRNEEFSDREFLMRDGEVQVERLWPDPTLKIFLEEDDSSTPTEIRPFRSQKRPAVQLRVRHPGVLDTLEFVETTDLDRPLGDYEIQIDTKAIGLNFRDVLVALGELQDDILGIECSGTVTSVGRLVEGLSPGDRVFGMHDGCFKGSIQVDSRAFHLLPDQLTYDEGATMACVFGTAYDALYQVARLHAGESVLIHSAAGGVGQAAICIAKHIGAIIYATVSSHEKRDFLVDTYGILPSNIFNSRDHSFRDGVLRMTDKRGVDVVLNSLAGEALRESWSCVAPFGRFIELGKRDIYNNVGLDMLPFLSNVTFAGVDLLSQARDFPSRFQKILRGVVGLLNDGVIHPLPITRFELKDVATAYQTMRSGKHMGKLVISCDQVNALPVLPMHHNSIRLSSQSTYILVGGLGGIGRSIGSMMIDIGASHLVFISRSMDSKREQYISHLRELGTTVEVLLCDVSDAQTLRPLMYDVKKRMPPIRGVINCAMNLKDGIFENMTATQWNESLRSKVQATQSLDQVLKALGTSLDFFICLSSVAGIIGSRGQSNYNAGNAFQDALAQSLSSADTHYTSINLSLVTDIGVSTTRDEVFQLLRGGALIGMNEEEVLSVIRATFTGRMPPQIVMGLASGGRLRDDGNPDPYWFADARFGPVRKHQTSTSGGNSDDNELGLKTLIPTLKIRSEVVQTILSHLIDKVSQITSISSEDLDPSRSPNSYGIDSLSAVELRSWISKETEVTVSIFDLVSNSTITELAEKISNESSLVSLDLKT